MEAIATIEAVEAVDTFGFVGAACDAVVGVSFGGNVGDSFGGSFGRIRSDSLKRRPLDGLDSRRRVV